MAWCLVKYRDNFTFTFYGLVDRGSVPRMGNDGIFSLRHGFQSGFGAHSFSYPMGTGRELKRLEREADHLPPSSAEVRNACIYTFTPPTHLHAVLN